MAPAPRRGLGSSPLARGALRLVGVDGRLVGIIPACAGSTLAPAHGAVVEWDHPRLRGEHGARGENPSRAVGSSPLARGALGRGLGRSCRVGIIPACAGSTRCHIRPPRAKRDHPRLRGEHAEQQNVGVLVKGSSPLARGALQLRRTRHQPQGIIPACAGSTVLCCNLGGYAQDHPRLRGEHRCAARRLPIPSGSSPLARGAHASDERKRLRTGIIPACAGSTVAPTSESSRGRDHPRLRGEHRRSSLAPPSRRGSSPLARGARDHM